MSCPAESCGPWWMPLAALAAGVAIAAFAGRC
jgi:hypothetical protein